MGYSLFKVGDFQNFLISRIFGVLFERFFAQNNSNVLVECFFACFWHFSFLAQTDHFAKAICSLYVGYSLCKMADFQNTLICRMFSVVLSGSLDRIIVMFLQNGFLHVFGIFNF